MNDVERPELCRYRYGRDTHSCWEKQLHRQVFYRLCRYTRLLRHFTLVEGLRLFERERGLAFL